MENPETSEKTKRPLKETQHAVYETICEINRLLKGITTKKEKKQIITDTCIKYDIPEKHIRNIASFDDKKFEKREATLIKTAEAKAAKEKEAAELLASGGKKTKKTRGKYFVEKKPI